MSKAADLDMQIRALQERLVALDQERADAAAELQELCRKQEARSVCADAEGPPAVVASVTSESSAASKIALFRSLFRGREDIFPRRWENSKTGKSGYAPACQNEWVRGICEKPRIKCGDCPHQAFILVSDAMIQSHLQGRDRVSNRPSSGSFTAGVYPMLPDETCWFLAADFDKQSWSHDASAYLATCREKDVPAVLERSRSGNGGHVWIFFSEPIPAGEARRLGSYLLTETMERCPDIGLDSYDRFFPSQDNMPVGGFGNLIALPLQHRPRENGNSVFIDEDLRPYEDQWAFLATTRRMTPPEVTALIEQAAVRGRILGVRMPLADSDDEPWALPPSRRRTEPPIAGELPKQVTMVLGNQVYIDRADL
ncbi:MAG: restriction endonuclease subunit R, partial [Proteobacteria bacterium]|nr:restriction endonuclease subunit R [Pseudomonadota bacterium]